MISFDAPTVEANAPVPVRAFKFISAGAYGTRPGALPPHGGVSCGTTRDQGNPKVARRSLKVEFELSWIF